MVEVEKSIVIARPVADVFAFVTDLSNDPQWHTDVARASRTTQGALGKGTEYAIDFAPGSGSTKGVARVTRFEPNLAAEYVVDAGSMKPTLSYRFEREAGSTRYTRRVEVPLPGLMKLMSPMVRRQVESRNERFLANLKQVLERTPK